MPRDAQIDTPTPFDAGPIVDLPAPRPLAPLSTARVTQSQPTLHWQLAGGATGALVEIFSDRSCTAREQIFVADGSAGRVPNALSPGVHFWRVSGRASQGTGRTPSSVWEMVVPHSSASRDTSWGTIPDFDGDGISEIVVSATGAPSTDDSADGVVAIYRGSPRSPSTMPTVTVHAPDPSTDAFGYGVTSIGDVNGDGFADLAVPGISPVESGRRLSMFAVYLGRSDLASWTTPDSVWTGSGPLSPYPVVAALGDSDGDGYADVAVNDGERIVVIRGSATGLATMPSQSLAPFNFGMVGSVSGAGDLNGDGFGDLVAVGNRITDIWFGRAGGFASEPSLMGMAGRGIVLAGPMDVNGDGFSDVGIGSPLMMFIGGPTFDGTNPPMILPGELTYGSGGDIDGDGLDDIVGVRTVMDAGGPTAADVEIFRGDRTALLVPSFSGRFQWHSPNGAALGARSVFIANDVNGDALADIVIGGAYGTGMQGGARVLLGSARDPFAAMPIELQRVMHPGFGAAVAGGESIDAHPRHRATWTTVCPVSSKTPAPGHRALDAA